MSTAEPFSQNETSNTGGTNFLLSAVRRWPWVLVGLLFGVVAGVSGLYLARPEVFQSNAQVLVIKKRADAIGNDSRMMLMEDYVATQVSVIKSERIMRGAALKVPVKDVASYFPADTTNPERETELRTKFLQAGFTVAREKDLNSSAAGTNVLNVAFKAGNPKDAQLFLQTVIETYSKELSSVYDEQTRKEIETFDRLIKSLDTEIAGLESKRSESQAAVVKITPEELPVIRVRVSKLIDQLRQLRQDEATIQGKLELAKNVGNDPRARGLLMAQLGDVGRGSAVPIGKVDVENPDTAIRTLRLQRAEQMKRFGPEHQVVQALDAQISYLEELNKPPVGGVGSLPLDSLAIAEQILKSRLTAIQKDIVTSEADLERDTRTLTTAGTLQNGIDSTTRLIQEKASLREQHRTKRTQLDVTSSAGGVEAAVLTRPEADATPVAPSLARAVMLGAAAGLILGLGLAALAELADKSFRSPAEIRSRLGLPVIGHIPPIRTGLPMDLPLDVETSLVCAVRPKSVEAEAYRGVRTSLYFSLQGRGHQVIQVTSPNPGDGKSTLATNLAVSVAQSGKRVLLVDCDFRRPRLHKIFKMETPGPGFVAVIIGESSLRDAVRPGPVENLSLLPCGTRPTNPAELLTCPEFARVIEQAKREFDFVILDTPPILAVSDPSVVAPRADGVILVFRMTSKARPQAERAREQLASLGANVLGVVVNGAGRASDGYGYGTGAGYHYDYEYEYADKYHDDDDDDEK